MGISREVQIDRAVKRRRKQTEERLSAHLEQASIGTTLDDIKERVFREGGSKKAFDRYLAPFWLGPGKTPDVTLLCLLQDAWNFFPHRRLNGSCPAEEVLTHMPALKPSELYATPSTLVRRFVGIWLRSRRS